MYCKHCGQPVEEDAHFCMHCGQAIQGEKPETTQETIQPKEKNNRAVILGLIAGLVLTAICAPLTLIARRQVLSSMLNPENRIREISPSSSYSPETNSGTQEKEQPTSQASAGSENTDYTATPSSANQDPTPENTLAPQGIQVSLLRGNAAGFAQPPEKIVYADDQAGEIPGWVQLAPFCQAGCFRYNGWLGLVSTGDSYDVIFTEPTSSLGVQIWGDPGDGIAHVFLDGELVWEGSTEGTDANYPGGAFVNYLQISNLPLIANHILRIETDAGGGAVTMYFFGSGEAVP